VLYPGTEEKRFREYHELLPGLGAFALSPAQDGEARGLSPLLKFIDEVITHVASQATQHERGRYWERQSFSRESESTSRSKSAALFLTKPPADSLVLLGFVKSQEHFEWVERTGRYNLRADERRGSVGLNAKELGADFVVLYGPGVDSATIWRVAGPAEIWARNQMIETQYPAPRGQLYLCLPIESLALAEFRLSGISVEAARRKHAPTALRGQPVVVTWQALLG